MKDFLLQTFPNPERKGCPEDRTIEALAEDRLAPGDPAALHVGSCSECFAEYRHYRLDWEGKQLTLPASFSTSQTPPEVLSSNTGTNKRTPALVAYAMAASLLLMGGGYIVFRHIHPGDTSAQQMASSPAVSSTVDLFSTGTLRGSEEDTAPLREVYLPAAIVQLSLILPRFSEVGKYRIDVSTDKTGKQSIASGIGNAFEGADGKVVVGVSLDLRKAKPGSYFLATVRGTDNGTYYYPLEVH